MRSRQPVAKRMAGCEAEQAPSDDDGPLVKWSRRGPLTPQTGVRLSHGSPHAPLAQLVEHLTLNQGVQGSSP